jgi:hypothetical protein
MEGQAPKSKASLTSAPQPLLCCRVCLKIDQTSHRSSALHSDRIITISCKASIDYIVSPMLPLMLWSPFSFRIPTMSLETKTRMTVSGASAIVQPYNYYNTLALRKARCYGERDFLTPCYQKTISYPIRHYLTHPHPWQLDPSLSYKPSDLC